MTATDSPDAALPRLTAALPTTGGVFEPSVADFEVEELPQYDASGEGDHLYLTIEKRNLTTRQLVRRVQEVFSVPEKDIGYAGMKDKHARTVQRISVLFGDPKRAAALEDDDVRVVEVSRHRNKLRVGHLRGNRFVVRLRGCEADAESRARAILDNLAARGLPNFFGDQRFGIGRSNVEDALAMVRGELKVKGRWKARLLASALQSHAFNAVLADRMAAGLFATVLEGDVLRKEGSGGIFVCTEPAVDQLRVDAWELSITGPMPGPKMRGPAEGSDPARREATVWDALALDPAATKRLARNAEGTRRPLRVPVWDPRVTAEDDALRLEFALPAGSYATVLVAEVTG